MKLEIYLTCRKSNKILFAFRCLICSRVQYMNIHFNKINSSLNLDKKEKMFNIRDKNIVITGSGRGIGLSLAIEIEKAGANVIRIDKNLSKSNLNFYDFKFDLEKINKILNLVKKINSKFKRIDGLINNAGVTFHNNLSLDKVYKTLNINLFRVLN